MKYYKLNNERMLIDMEAPAPLISIPLELWENGFNVFSALWVKCYFVRTVVEESGRILFTVFINDDYNTNKICLYHGTKDVTHKNWDTFEDYLEKSETKKQGYSYISVNSDDPREWWEFHAYEETVVSVNQRPELIFSSDIVNDLKSEN